VVLHGEEVAATVFGGDLESGGSVGQGALEAVTILPGRDGRGIRSSRDRGLTCAGEETGRKGGSEKLEKRATFEGVHRSLLEGMGVSIDREWISRMGYSLGFELRSNDPP
jgi:hypothetical protein